MRRTNLLLIGARPDTEQVVRALWPLDRQFTWRPGQPLNLPSDGATVVLHDVDGMRLNEQRRLLAWLESGPARTQVVSTATAPFVQQVERGTFLDVLYYRLNTVCVDVRD